MFTKSSNYSSLTDYAVAGLATATWLWISRYLPMVSGAPILAAFAAIVVMVLLYRAGPVALSIAVSVVGVELLRPMPTLLQTINRGLFLAFFGVMLAAFSAFRTARFGAARQYEVFFDLNPLPMWVFDLRTAKFLAVNSAAVRTYGYSRDQFASMTLRDVRPDDEHLLEKDLAATPNEPGVRQHRTRDGRILQIFVRWQDVDLGGRRARLALLEDVTERTALEQQLRQAQKMEAVGQLAGGIAHDFNNLLAVIQGFSALAYESLALNDPRRHDLDEVIKAGNRASQLTRQLLAFSRKQLLQMRVLSISDVVNDLVPMLRRLISETVTFDVRPSALGLAKGDSGQLQQVILNLVVNARDAMEGPGRITIETADVSLDAEYCRQHSSVRPGPHVMLAVSDTGRGMDPDTKAHIFEPFFTTKPNGTGLGLATVYGIVSQSGGHVWVYSEIGRGTTFKVYFPRTEEALEPVVAKLPVSQNGDSRIVLLVEDEAGVRSVATRILRNADYAVHPADSPKQAIAMVTAGLKPAVLLTDMVLPEMNGQELAKAVLAQCPECKVVVMSGYTDATLFRPGDLQFAVVFLEKPFTVASLTGAISDVLSLKAPGMIS